MSIRIRFPVNPPTSYDCVCGNSTYNITDWVPYDSANCEVSVVHAQRRSVQIENIIYIIHRN